MQSSFDERELILDGCSGELSISELLATSVAILTSFFVFLFCDKFSVTLCFHEILRFLPILSFCSLHQHFIFVNLNKKIAFDVHVIRFFFLTGAWC